jgi:hypothetical protein
MDRIGMKNKNSVELNIKNMIETGIILILSILLLTNAASALDTGWVAPTSNSGGSGVTNPQYAYADDTSYANFASGGLSSWNYSYNFSSIPAGATINGIEVNTLGYLTGNGNRKNMRVNLSWDSGITFPIFKDNIEDWTTSVNNHIVGGPTDQWGHSPAWTRDEIVNKFRVKVTWRGSDSTAYLDYLPVRVNYTMPIDTSRPSVTVNQASGQADPTKNSPINFAVVFNESVSDFVNTDVTIGGTAAGTKSVAVTGGGSNYNVEVSGMTDGNVTMSIAENVAHDATGNGNTGSSSTDNTVTFDTTAPTIASHGDVTSEATSNAGALVSFISPVTSDAVDGAGVASCLPVSGSTFAMGDIIVTCSATDAAGNTASTTFKVTVYDTIAPTIDSVTSIVAEATSSSGATVTITPPMSHDAVDGNLASYCDQSTGTFPIGVTTVTCSKTDAHGNVANPSVFTVSVQYTIAPTIDSVTSIVAEATSSSGATVTITPPMSHDAVDGDLVSSCDKSTGIFTFGVTTVTCTKTDAHGNVATPSVFTVTVQDTTNPIIALIGSGTVNVELGSTYIDAGATATDNYDTIVNVTTSGSVNASLVGPYILTYNATDSSGNAAIPVTRTVNVIAASTYSVSGYVSNNLGAGLAGVLVQSGSNTATTATNGSYSISGLLNGVYNFSYTKTDYGRGYVEVTVSGADLTNQNRTLNSLPAIRYINGTVIDSGLHTPLAGVTVSTTGHSTVTDGSGKYSLAVASGSYNLTASYDIRYYTNSSVTVSTEFDAVVNQDIELHLKPTGTISGAVTVR